MDNEVLTDKFKIAFLMLFFHEYKVFQENGRVEVEPEGIVKAKKEIVGADENIISIFTSVFAAITNSCNDYIESKHIEQWLKHGNYKVSVTKFGLEMNKYAKLHKQENVYKSYIYDIYCTETSSNQF